MTKKTQEQISNNMSHVHSKDSKIELLLRRELWKRGLRYRKNAKTVYGKPDIAFIGSKIAVFCDSEFWHGYCWTENKNRIKSNRDFWLPKIERTIERDIEVNEKLKRQGWLVLRFWGKDIAKDPSRCAEIVEKAIKERMNHDI